MPNFIKAKSHKTKSRKIRAACISNDDLMTVSQKSVTTSYFILVVVATGITMYSSLVSW